MSAYSYERDEWNRAHDWRSETDLDPSDADVDPVAVTAEQVAEYVAALNAHVAAMREAS